MRHPLCLFLVSGILLGGTLSAQDSAPWTDLTSAAGLGQNAVARLKFVDLNANGRPDIVMLPTTGKSTPPLVYLQSESSGPGVPNYVPKADTGLPPLQRGDILVFADLDNDGIQDAILGRHLDIYQDDYEPPEFAPTRTAWLKGLGDGSFAAPIPLEAAQLATTMAIAVGDVNADGLPDIFIGNGYERYFTGYEAFDNDLLLQYRDKDDNPAFVRWPLPDETRITTHEEDLGGRPTYGVALPRLDDGLPMLMEMSYGRRWNRLYQLAPREPLNPPRQNLPDSGPLVPQDDRARAAHLIRELRGENIAAQTHLDGDAIRHGRHPRWPLRDASLQPRSLRPDEAPFRANGNTFDVAVGDIDNDGDFDLFFSTIIHAWAGESSDRSRFLVNQTQETGVLDFLSFEHLSVDRIPALPLAGTPLEAIHMTYNQGDIYAELADLNNDGRLDLILCSSDYPDPPPYEERLRVYFQQEDGRFRDVTRELGIDHVGAGMPSLADVDGDGALDLIVGQSFNRLTPVQRRAAALASGALPPDAGEDDRPQTRARLFRNESAGHRQSVMIDLIGDPEQGTTRDAYGTIVRMAADLDGDPETPDGVQLRQVLGPVGHAGKQHMRTLHFGLGEATKARWIEVFWSGTKGDPLRLENIPAGRYRLQQSNASLTPVE